MGNDRDKETEETTPQFRASLLVNMDKAQRFVNRWATIGVIVGVITIAIALAMPLLVGVK